MYFRDQDSDGFGTNDSVCASAPSGQYTALQSGDCNDANATVHPGAIEVCDTKDNDCDGQVDEQGASGCTTYYVDADGDGYGVTANAKCLCAPDGFYTASTGGDCNDSNPLVHPGTAEVCDGQDNDCDSTTDEGGDALCADALFCNGIEVCAGTFGCQSGTAIDCSPYSIPTINQCDFNPDGNPYTWDYAPAYTSVCNETTDSCTQNYQFTHTCNIPTCGAVCDGAEDCPLQCTGTKVYNLIRCNLTTGCVCQYANPICVKNLCGAQCKIDSDCPNQAGYTKRCNTDTCGCEYTPI